MHGGIFFIYKSPIIMVMVMKRYSTLLKSPELEPKYQMQFSVISQTLIIWRVVLSFCRR